MGKMNGEKDGRSGLIKRVCHYAAILTAVCLLGGAGVSLLYVASADRIEQQEKKAFEQTLAEVIGDAEAPEELVENRIWAADIPGSGIRYVAEGSARGYQSKIRVLVSVDAEEAETPVSDDTPLYRLAVLSSAETPGLGENINLVERTVTLWQAMLGAREEPGRPWFQTQFGGKNLAALELQEKDGDIRPVTGATETSDAAVRAARQALNIIIEETARLYR